MIAPSYLLSSLVNRLEEDNHSIVLDTDLNSSPSLRVEELYAFIGKARALVRDDLIPNMSMWESENIFC